MINGLLFFIKRITKLLFLQFLFDVSKQIKVKYYSDFHVKEPHQASKTLLYMMFLLQKLKFFLPKSVNSVSLEMIWAIPSGFYGKPFPRSGMLREHLVTVDAGVIGYDFRGKVATLLFNHHPEKTFTVRAGDRIGQVVFMEKFAANFQRFTDKHLLGITKCGSDGFGSTGVSVIRKEKLFELGVSSEDNEVQTISEEVTSEKATSEEAVMTADKEVEMNAPSSDEPQITSEVKLLFMNQ